MINVEAFRGAIRKGDWKLVKVALLPGKVEPFNLAKGAGEKDNVAEQNPDLVKDLEARLLGYAKEQVPSEWIKAQPAFLGAQGHTIFDPDFDIDDAGVLARKAAAAQRGWPSPKMRRLRARLKRNAGRTRALGCSIPEAGGEQAVCDHARQLAAPSTSPNSPSRAYIVPWRGPGHSHRDWAAQPLRSAPCQLGVVQAMRTRIGPRQAERRSICALAASLEERRIADLWLGCGGGERLGFYPSPR